MADDKKGEPEQGRAELSREPLYKYHDPDVPKELPDQSWSTERLIEAATKDNNLLTRSNAVTILATREGKEAVEALVQALKDSEHIVKSTAMVKLASRGQEVLDRVMEAMSDADQDIRAGAAWVLGELKDPRSVEVLQKAIKDESQLVRVQAKASLMAMGIIKKKDLT